MRVWGTIANPTIFSLNYKCIYCISTWNDRTRRWINNNSTFRILVKKSTQSRSAIKVGTTQAKSPSLSERNMFFGGYDLSFAFPRIRDCYRCDDPRVCYLNHFMYCAPFCHPATNPKIPTSGSTHTSDCASEPWGRHKNHFVCSLSRASPVTAMNKSTWFCGRWEAGWGAGKRIYLRQISANFSNLKNWGRENGKGRRKKEAKVWRIVGKAFNAVSAGFTGPSSRL